VIESKQFWSKLKISQILFKNKRTAWRFMRIIEIENSKRKKATIKESKAIIEKKKEVIKR
jgi:DNA mismatch repair protein MutS2